MTWILSHWQDILSALGAIYTAAHAIVILTPTPKDDEDLEKTVFWVKWICKFLPFDPTRGINNDKK